MKLFGFELPTTKKEIKKAITAIVPPTAEDGAINLVSGMFVGQYVDIDGTSKNESELIARYREMSFHSDCEMAINDICNNAIIINRHKSPVSINLDGLDVSDKSKEIISEEFNKVLRLLNFTSNGFELFRRWYVDGRLFILKLIDEKNPSAGMIELRNINPMQIRKIREIEKSFDENHNVVSKLKREYYVFDEIGMDWSVPVTANTGSKIEKDSVCYVHSGVIDTTRGMVLSHLHKGIKPLNQLRMMEDSLVIYRMVRAPERRIFYIDVGNLPPKKVEEYVRSIMDQYRNKIIYDFNTGEVRDDRQHYSMVEDYWMPRRDGKSTQIETLKGGENLGQMEDVVYFQKKLLKCLNVPQSRLSEEGGGLNLGKSSEISRDELTYSKFIQTLTTKFSDLFQDLLKTQLVLRGFCTQEEWNILKQGIWFDFVKDSYYEDTKDAEILRDKIDLANSLQPWIGITHSMYYIQKNIFKMTDDEIEREKKQIEIEKKENPDVFVHPTDPNKVNPNMRIAGTPDISELQTGKPNQKY